MFNNLTGSLAHIQSGAVRALAVTTAAAESAGRSFVEGSRLSALGKLGK
jgi:hypothetical protein